MTLHGTPAQIEYGGNDLVTTEPAPTTVPRPILTPFNIVTFIPIQLSPSIKISWSFIGSFSLSVIASIYLAIISTR